MLEDLEVISSFFIVLIITVQLLKVGQKTRIGLLVALYVAAFVLINLEWSLALAISFLLAGWVGGAVLGMGLISLHSLNVDNGRKDNIERRLPSLIPLVSAAVIFLFAYSFGPLVSDWIPTLSVYQGGISILLVGSGILQLTFYQEALPTTTGSLVLLIGFEILIAGLSATIFLAAMLSAITLIICLIGTYLLLIEVNQGGIP